VGVHVSEAGEDGGGVKQCRPGRRGALGVEGLGELGTGVWSSCVGLGTGQVVELTAGTRGEGTGLGELATGVGGGFWGALLG
jgi:hypothetical protein